MKKKIILNDLTEGEIDRAILNDQLKAGIAELSPKFSINIFSLIRKLLRSG